MWTRTLFLGGIGAAFVGSLAANVLGWPIANIVAIFGFGIAMIAGLFAWGRAGFPTSGSNGGGGGDGGDGGGDGGGD